MRQQSQVQTEIEAYYMANYTNLLLLGRVQLSLVGSMLVEGSWLKLPAILIIALAHCCNCELKSSGLDLDGT